ncbi:DNA polymerase delta subunit 3 [Xylocopa sonorina]|uniref:DNA polymerase delta subunit 3 n=1 Tax=Xylocopa sonorina TaxID=1818115 RepID=UPI00403A9E99
MVMESLDEYLETVVGYVFDNDKLVTYKWLSKELEIHVNTAKQILWEFWQKYKKKKDFECTFLFMGTLHDDGMHVEVVKEKDLQTAKEKYAKVISEHVYSIQKALPELQLLGTAENGDIRYSAIKLINNNVRSDKEMHTLRWGAVSDEIQLISQEKVQLVSGSDKTEVVISPEKKEIDKKKNADQKGFNNLFGKAINKQKNPPVSSSMEKMEMDSFHHTKQISKNVAPESSKKVTQKGGLNNFLQQNNDQVKTTDLPERKNNKNSSDENVVTTKTGNKQKKNLRGKKRNRSRETTKIAKKRKRITIQSDSSDAEPSDVEPEEEIPPSPENIPPIREHSVSPPKHKVENGKRKVLKKVDKTFEEDGFLVTKKVHVYESCSEDDLDVAESKKPPALESHSEQKGKKNTKQTSLTNFFKKL